MRNNFVVATVISFIFYLPVIAQTGMINSGNTLIISSGSNVKIYENGGGVTNNSFLGTDGAINNDGTIILEGNWANNANNNVFINLNSNGTVIFNGTTLQEIGGSGNSTRFENLTINNSAAASVTLSGSYDQFIENQLTFIDGIIITNSNKIIVSNTDYTSIDGYNNTNFIYGNLRRYIDSNTETYAFPVGKGINSTDYYLSELLNNNLTGMNYIDVYFGDLTNHNDPDLSVSESGMTYNSFGTEGVWFLNPDNPSTGGNYSLRCYIENFSGLYDNRFAILSRPDNSLTAADWDCTPCGIGNPGINPDGGNGRILSDGYALRQGYTTFSQFGIGKIDCQMAQLPADINICEGDSIVLYPGSFSSYLWSTGSNDSMITVNTSGQYFVEVTNINPGCGTSSDTINVNVTTIGYTSNVQNISCYGYNDGEISIVPTGGTPDYHYTWDPVQPDTSHITGLPPQSYTVVISDDNGCSVTILKIQIGEPDSLIFTFSVSDPMCYGISDGQISISPSGGTAPYYFNWSNGGSDSVLSALSSGNYNITLTDSNGCSQTGSYSLSNASQILINGYAGVSINHFGYVNTSAHGGYTPYSYSWSNGGNTQSIENLLTGQYYLTVTDFYGCIAVDTFLIEIPLLIPSLITPNGDGYNDTWDILNIETYESVTVEIFNRWGDIVFSYSGTGAGYKDISTQWDGKWNGSDLPMGSYVYILNLNDFTEHYNGVVSIKK